MHMRATAGRCAASTRDEPVKGRTMSHAVLITGCSSGIGRDLAQRLTTSGYTVVATARKAETLDDLPAALKLPLDVTQAESVKQAVDCALQRFGRIDVLVNNAGYALPGAIEEISDEQIHQLFDVNVFGVIRMIRAVVPHMRHQGAGRIINMSSIAGKRAIPVNGTYCATKFALEALSDALRLELAPFGIQVVLIEPGSIKTQFAVTAQARAQAMMTCCSPGLRVCTSVLAWGSLRWLRLSGWLKTAGIPIKLSISVICRRRSS